MIYKVKDLLAALQKCDPELYVGHRVFDDGYFFVDAICGVTSRVVNPEEMGRGFNPCQCQLVIIDEVPSDD